MQQRSIPPLVISWPLQFGRMHYDHRGGVVYFLDKRARRDLEQAVGSRVVSRLSDYLDAYAVLAASDDTLVTVGHRYRRLARG